MKKRKQTCSTKHIHCAKVSENLFSLQKLYFTASIAAIVCCLGKNPRKENFEFFSRNILATFSNSEKCKKWCLGQKEWKQALLALWPLFGHFGHIERSIWTYCSSIQTYCSCFWTCWPPPIAVIFCQFLRKSACQKVPFMQPWRRASLVASEILCFQRKVLFDKKLNRPLNHQEQEDFN